RARLGRLDDDGVRRTAPQPSVRSDGRAPRRRGAARVVRGGLRTTAADGRALAERRRRRRAADALVQGGAAVERHGEPDRAGRCRPLHLLGRGPAGCVPVHVDRPARRWDGRTDDGAAVYSGRYVARLTAVSDVGTVSLTTPFNVRRLPGRR